MCTNTFTNETKNVIYRIRMNLIAAMRLSGFGSVLRTIDQYILIRIH